MSKKNGSFAQLKALKKRRPANKPVATPAIPKATESDDSDLALFRRAMVHILPLRHTERADVSLPPPPPVPRQRHLDEAAVLSDSVTTTPDFEDLLDNGEESAFLRPGLPRRVLIDLRRGRWVTQGKLDLHGLTRDEAHQAMTQFLNQALAQGKRCLRIIHGKGLGSPGGVPVLKYLSRQWLTRHEEILAFCQPNAHEGGAGALLVLLRSPAKRQ